MYFMNLRFIAAYYESQRIITIWIERVYINDKKCRMEFHETEISYSSDFCVNLFIHEANI